MTAPSAGERQPGPELAAAARIVTAFADALEEAGGFGHQAQLVRALCNMFRGQPYTDDCAEKVAAALLNAARCEVLPVMTSCGEGHDPTAVCCRHAGEAKQLREAAPAEPRVWLPGDTVPADTYFVDHYDEVAWSRAGTVLASNCPAIEVHVPRDFHKRVAVERKRRSGGESDNGS